MSFKSDIKSLILASLQEGPMHGYLIAKSIKQASQSVLKIGESAIYPALQELEESGAIQSVWEPQEGRPPRKVYNLTPKGHEDFVAYKQAWESFSKAVSSVLTPSSPKGAAHE